MKVVVFKLCVVVDVVDNEQLLKKTKERVLEIKINKKFLMSVEKHEIVCLWLEHTHKKGSVTKSKTKFGFLVVTQSRPP